MDLNDAYTFGWVALLLLGGGLEYAAIRDKARGDTLSEHIWALFAVKGGGKFALARRGILLAGLGWAFVHLGFGV